jgi:hypothetical protein
MKNVHILPTDKPSRLCLRNGKLKLSPLKFTNDEEIEWYNQNIYITSEEEIKGKDWYLELNLGIFRKSTDKHYLKGEFDSYKKIILTTDPDLIAEGIQELPEDVIQYLVENPSCEWVEVKRYYETLQDGLTFDRIDYKIIIPKEEPKTGSMTECIKMIIDNQLNELEELKQKTLEEAAEKYENSFKESIGIEAVDFIAGAKWQAERMYSEEEVIELLKKALTHKDDGETGSLVTAQGEIRPANFYSWFEQFKKK